MNKRKIVNSIMLALFCAFIFVGSISLVGTYYMAFVEGVSSSEDELRIAATTDFAFAWGLALSSMALAIGFLACLARGKKPSPNLLIGLIGFYGVCLASTSMVDLVLLDGWNVGYMWVEFMTGVFFIVLCLLFFIFKKKYKPLIGAITAMWAMSYCFYSAVSYMETVINGYVFVWFNFGLAFLLVVAFFIYQIIHSSLEERKEEKKEE